VAAPIVGSDLVSSSCLAASCQTHSLAGAIPFVIGRSGIVFEGRDAAGKGGTIKAITERVSPRVFRLVALPAPSDREKTQMYMQRYIQHFPAAGEIVIFDRSWYNRAGVERVMGFCTDEQYQRFLDVCPMFEKQIVTGGIILIKFWLEVGKQEQERRFEARIDDPMRQWKLSPMDVESWTAGTTTPEPAMRCSKPPTPTTHRGTSCVRTTRSGRV
jgi:polyphosphate kinase 2